MKLKDNIANNDKINKNKLDLNWYFREIIKNIISEGDTQLNKNKDNENDKR